MPEENNLQATEAVIIKGVREGLLLIVDDDVPFAQVLTELISRINAQPNFFKGATVILWDGQKRIGTSGIRAKPRNTSPARTTSSTRVTRMRRSHGFFAVSDPSWYR